jgi:S-formylglutathione hydrolase FrmB
MEKDNNFLLGLSTGGRGVCLVYLNNKKIFQAAASLSGDFDQSTMPGDRIMTAVYGKYENFPERWTGSDNIQKRISEWEIPVYLGHGQKDKIVPFSQTLEFYKALKKSKPELEIAFHDPKEEGHDYKYWDSETISVFEFFKKHLKN